jgi:hypothetical protein
MFNIYFRFLWFSGPLLDNVCKLLYFFLLSFLFVMWILRNVDLLYLNGVYLLASLEL